jgi:predicted DNA-binding transcriptional regulator AlpA
VKSPGHFDRGPVDRFVSFRELLFRLGHPSRMQVYRRIKAGQLPQPTKPFGGKLYWRESEIDAVTARPLNVPRSLRPGTATPARQGQCGVGSRRGPGPSAARRGMLWLCCGRGTTRRHVEPGMKNLLQRLRSWWYSPPLEIFFAIILTREFVRGRSDDWWPSVSLVMATGLLYSAITTIAKRAQDPQDATEIEDDAVDWHRKAQEAAKAGQIINAIRYVRLGTGMGFAEAKTFVEKMDQQTTDS